MNSFPFRTAAQRNKQAVSGRLCLVGLLLVFSLVGTTVSPLRADDRDDRFETTIRPLLLQRCVECHGPAKQEGGLRLDQRQQVLIGSDELSAVVVPGNPDDSRLLQVLAHAEGDVQMPPSGKLPENEIAALRQWVVDGAAWPENSTIEADAVELRNRWKQHWAFQPPRMPDLTGMTAETNPVDFLISSRLSAAGLEFSPRASGRTLVRRVSYALTGLPPEMADLQAGDAAEQSGTLTVFLEAYIDRQLASPHFGERWGRYWMDVSRYADTKGYVFTEDREYPEAWKYREWVIQALNADMPYDEFLKRQLAADRMSGSEDPAQLAAMGYLTLGRRFLNNKHDIIDDRIDVVSRGMQGLTVTCARCHDHKYDPIPMADYYALYGVFDSSEEPNNEPSRLRLVDKASPVTPVVFLRGNPANRGDPVPRRFLSALSGPDAAPFSDGSGRLELASAIASRSNPLTARVAVNRVWMHLFGRGLVDSPSDFGVRTDPPIQPELLDFLALRLMDENWSMKRVIRLVLTSRTWQQSSAERPDAVKVDPENRLFARMNRLRLDFESHRDTILSVAGRLDPVVGGPSVEITDPNAPGRRTIYARIDRQNLPGIFRTFDLANPDTHAPRRFQTMVPQQALYQMNNPFMLNSAAAVVSSVEAAHPDSDDLQKIGDLFERILQRAPTEKELSAAQTLVTAQKTDDLAELQRGGWSYGYGTVDVAAKSVGQFVLFPAFQKRSWQGGEEMPHPQLGWASLNRGGGHPGVSPGFSVIRRWTTDTDCRVQITGQLRHGSPHGNGIVGIVATPSPAESISSPVHNAEQTMDLPELALKAGEHVDFVVDSNGDVSFDSFQWTIQIRQSVGGVVARTWSSGQDFSGRQPRPLLSVWPQLAQTLMMTNEFVFVD